MEESVSFLSGDLNIEGLLQKNASGRGVVVTHPHPLYGGDMYNAIVEVIVQAYQKKRYTTLRFNFRGTGASQGAFDNGSGEQEDVGSAIVYLMNHGIDSVDLAGYSFGASVNIRAVEKGVGGDGVQRLVMVSPPIGMTEVDRTKTINQPGLVVTGSRDHIAPASTIEKLLPRWQPHARLSIIDGADHFYSGYLDQLASVLSDYLSSDNP